MYSISVIFIFKFLFQKVKALNVIGCNKKWYELRFNKIVKENQVECTEEKCKYITDYYLTKKLAPSNIYRIICWESSAKLSDAKHNRMACQQLAVAVALYIVCITIVRWSWTSNSASRFLSIYFRWKSFYIFTEKQNLYMHSIYNIVYST